LWRDKRRIDMANIIRRRGEERGELQRGWEPLRLFQEMLRWDPFAEMTPLLSAERGAFVPQFEVKERGDAFVIKADLPGVKDEELDISLTGGRLTVAGKREAEERTEGESYYTYERSFGRFTRTFTLPEGVDADHVQAELKEGVLTLVLPKLPEIQPKKVQLKGLKGEKTGKA
jgi:HSP20 family protein